MLTNLAPYASVGDVDGVQRPVFANQGPPGVWGSDARASEQGGPEETRRRRDRDEGREGGKHGRKRVRQDERRRRHKRRELEGARDEQRRSGGSPLFFPRR